MKMLRDAGIEVVCRTAGSHSKFDVIAIDAEHHEIQLIQCKSGASKERELSKLARLKDYAGIYSVKVYAL